MTGPVAVTGGAGFLGEHLLHALVAAGHEVHASCRRRTVSAPGVRWTPVDLADDVATKSWLDQVRPGTVLHLAALTDVAACEGRPEDARAAIIDATANVTAALAAGHPDAFLVSLSTDLVFDGRDAPYRPGDPPRPLSEYARCKLAAERIAAGRPAAAVLRAALIYGPPATHKGSFLSWMHRTLLADEPLRLFADEFRTPVFVGDLVQAILGVARRRAAGIRHAGGPQRLSRLEMGQALCRVTGLSPDLLVPTRRAESDYDAPRPPDVSLVSDDLWRTIGHHPTDFAAGVRRSLES